MTQENNQNEYIEIVGNQESSTQEHVTVDFRQPASTGKDVNIGIGIDGDAIVSRDKKPEISRRARAFLATYPNHNQVQQAFEVLNNIDGIVDTFIDLKLPDIEISAGEDGTIGMTWKVVDAKLGISIDLDPKESSWFLLIGDDLKKVTAYGTLGKFDIDLLLRWILFLLERIHSKGQNEHE